MSKISLLKNPLPNPPLIPTANIFKNAPRSWCAGPTGSIFEEEIMNPQILNLETLKDTVWTHPTQEARKDKLFLTGHQYLGLLLPSYSKEERADLRGSYAFKTYKVGPNDLIRNHYNLDVLEWLKANMEFLPEEFSGWVISNGFSLCAWAGATRCKDGRICIPELDLESRTIGWSYLGAYVTSISQSLSSRAYEAPRPKARFF